MSGGRSYLLVSVTATMLLLSQTPVAQLMPNSPDTYADMVPLEDSTWQATGTILAEGERVRLAIIEDVHSGAAITVREGSRIFDGVRVAAVHRDFITLRVDGETRRLRIVRGSDPSDGDQQLRLTDIMLERKSPSSFAMSYNDFRGLLDAVSRYGARNMIRRINSADHDNFLQIKAVPPASILDRLGLEPGDVIVAMQGRAINGFARADAVLQAMNPGSVLQVVYRRTGSIRQLSVEITGEERRE